MSLTVSCTVNVSVEEVSVNSVEKAMLRGTKEAGQKLLLAPLELTEKTVARGRRCACGRAAGESGPGGKGVDDVGGGYHF